MYIASSLPFHGDLAYEKKHVETQRYDISGVGFGRVGYGGQRPAPELTSILCGHEQGSGEGRGLIEKV